MTAEPAFQNRGRGRRGEAFGNDPLRSLELLRMLRPYFHGEVRGKQFLRLTPTGAMG